MLIRGILLRIIVLLICHNMKVIRGHLRDKAAVDRALRERYACSMRRLLKLSGFLVGQFLLFSVVAMAFYPGGNHVEHRTERYELFSNTFSELGRVRTYTGEPKPISRHIFSTSVSVAGIGVLLFLLGLSFHIRRAGIHRERKSLLVVALLFGVLTAGGFELIALSPADTAFELHFVGVYSAFTGFLPTALCFGQLLRRGNGADREASRVLFAFSLLLVAYVVLIYFGPTVQTPEGHEIQVVAQKTIVYAGIGTIAAVAHVLGRRRSG